MRRASFRNPPRRTSTRGRHSRLPNPAEIPRAASRSRVFRVRDMLFYLRTVVATRREWPRAARALATFSVIAAAWLLPAGGAYAAEQATITVRVVEDVSKAPIPRVGVRLVSTERQYDGVSDASGSVRFSGVEPGSYGVFASDPDYAFADTSAITAKASSASAVTVLGTRTRPRRIGSVQSRTDARPSAATSQATEAAAALLAGSVGASLPNITALGVGPSANSLTIHNEGPASTTATINGAPLFPSGSRIPLGLLRGDLFSSAGIGPGTIGAPSGTLNIQTYEPVIDWSGLAQVRGAAFGSTATAIQERGTAGRFGLAFAHSDTVERSGFDGRAFADTSGSFYFHDTAQRSGGDTFTLRYGFSPIHTGHLDIGRLSSVSTVYCAVESGPLPCGIGPGNVQRRALSYVQVRDEFSVGSGTLNVNLFQSLTDDTSDLAHQTAGGDAVGSFSSSTTRRSGAVLGMRYAVSRDRVASLSFSTVADSTRFLGVATPAQPAPSQNAARSSLTLSVPVFKTRRLTNRINIGSDTGSGRSSTVYGADASYELTTRDTLAVSFSNGRIPSRVFGFNGVDIPELLQVDCASGRAAGNGPSSDDAPGPTQQMSLEYKRLMRSYQVDVNAYRHVAQHAVVTGTLPGSALPPSLFGAGYFTQAGSTATRECGAAIDLSSPSNLFYTATSPVDRLVSDGFDAALQADITPRANVSVAYSLARLRAFGSSPLFVPGSTVAAAQQIPGAPLHRVNAAARFALSRATTGLVNANFFGANNPWSARSFATIDAGVRTRFAGGDVIVGWQNVTNANGDPFGRFDPFPTLTQPYIPRTLSVRARIALGRQDIDRAQYLSRALSPSAVLFTEPAEFEPAGPRGWLAPATDAPFCGPEVLAKAKIYQNAIAQFEADIRRTPTQLGTPAPAIPSRSVDGMSLSELSGANGAYVIRIEFERGRAQALGSFLKCSVVHEGTYDRAQALGLYIPGWQQRESDAQWVLYYAAVSGLYFAPDPVNQTSGTFVASGELPKSAPAAPFAVGSCPDSMMPAVSESVALVKAYVVAYYGGLKPTAPAGFRISAHAARAETWLEIRPDNMAVSTALAQCLNIPAVDEAAIGRRGLGGALTPSLNYAPSVGFYTRTL